LVERLHGKEEVTGSIPVQGSTLFNFKKHLKFMAKGELPVPYIVALILAVIVIAIIAYLLFTYFSGSNSELKISQCKGKQTQYCLEWYKNSPDYDALKSPGNWETYAPGCTSYGITVTSDICKTSV
jgi:hypothetical protein